MSGKRRGGGASGGSVSGSYTLVGGKGEISSMDRQGSTGSNNYGVSWTYHSSLINSKGITDIGTYPAGGGMSGVSTYHFGSTETDSFWANSPGSNWGWSYTSSSSSDASYPISGPDGVTESQADPGPPPPAEATDGQQPGADKAWYNDEAGDCQVAHQMCPTLFPTGGAKKETVLSGLRVGRAVASLVLRSARSEKKQRVEMHLLQREALSHGTFLLAAKNEQITTTASPIAWAAGPH